MKFQLAFSLKVVQYFKDTILPVIPGFNCSENNKLFILYPLHNLSPNGFRRKEPKYSLGNLDQPPLSLDYFLITQAY